MNTCDSEKCQGVTDNCADCLQIIVDVYNRRIAKLRGESEHERLVDRDKIHASHLVALHQIRDAINSLAEAWRFANNNSQRVVIGGNYEAPKKRVEDSEMVREFDGSFSGALDLMATGSCCTIKGDHPKKYYIIDVWGTLKAHAGDGLWSTPWLTREMMRGKWEFFSDQIPYGPIGESEARK